MKWLKSGILLVAVLSTVQTAPTLFADEDSMRLPKTSKPIHYDISLKTDVHEGLRSFEGEVLIEIEIAEDTNVITLHNRELTILEVKLLDETNNLVETLHQDEIEKEFLHIESTSKPLLSGEKYTIEISYSGLLQLGTSGFYRSSYKVDNETRYLAATQFESTNARYAFVCYDEPEFKAEFSLKITHGSSYHAISNTEGTEVDDGNGYTTTTFDKSPRMSSYLLAFLVSDFKANTNENDIETGQTIQRIFAREADVDRTDLALDVSAKFLIELERYAKYDYELVKMDSAAIPDFGAGAMENWGAIFYKEQYLIGDENSHPRDVLEILKTVAHELGHQFFGNVVTAEWWDQIWLNEGFATLFEFLLVENIYPSHRMRDYFNIQKLQNALKADSLETSRAMLSYAETPEGISGLFDRIAYDKSGSVIRMFQHAVGEDIFRDSLSRYLSDNKYQPVTSDKLYQAFETVIAEKGVSLGFSFTDAFKSWEIQKGYPIIHVTLDEEEQQFVITQERYYAASETKVENDERSWYIPLSFTTESNSDFEDTQFTDFFVNGEATKTIEFPTEFSPNEWFIFNKQQIGFYRVNYDTRNWYELIKILNSGNFEQIHVLNRAQLVDDSLNFAADGYLDYQTAFGLLNYLERETDYIPWRAALLNLDKLDYMLKGRSAHESFTKFVKQLLRRYFVTFGFVERPEDSLIDRFAREQAIDWTCRLGDEKCLADAYTHVKQAVDEEQDLPDSLEIVYLCHGLKGLNKQDLFVKYWQKMQSSTDQAERLRIIDGLMCSTDPNSLKDLLDTTFAYSNEVDYRTHERQRILNNVLIRSPIGVEVTIDVISEFFEEIVDMFSQSAVESLIIAASRRISLYEDQVKLTDLFDKLDDKISDSTRTTAMKNIDDNKVWAESSRYLDVAIYTSSQVQAAEDIENQLILPKTSEPKHYNIHIDARNIHTGATGFTGEVEIEVLIKEATEYIIFHSKTQVIDELKVFNKNDQTEIKLLDYKLYSAADTLTIYFFEELAQNSEIIVHIKYSTNLPTFGSGFYQTSYVMDGVRHYLGTTQFQPTGARYAFPHYDEPEYKVVFDLKITHDESFSAIANTYGVESDNGDGTVTSIFLPTPLMSSYLLAFVVSDFDHISNENEIQTGETVHRVWVRPDSVKKAPYALEHSAKVLKTLEEYIGFDFELPKVDSAAIPNKGGAMENWGMVTYWETAMIYEESYDDISHALKLSGVDVISHELAHQFFGDSVTCKWWDVTWLNEGFATLFEFHLTGILYPEWNLRHFFNLRKLHNSFRYDGIERRPMTNSVETLAQISNAFDTIAYDKSGSVLRMFQNVVGEEIFKESLKHYLETNNHKPVVPQNLIDAFKDKLAEHNVDDLDFETAFRTWELQAGYPVITVTFQTNHFRITQERYFNTKRTNSTDTSSWYIPLNFATQSNPDFDDTKITDYFMDGQAVAAVAAPSGFDATQWFVFNKQQLGYYRVNYDSDNWNALIAALNSENYAEIHVLNRVQLVDDSINFAAGGYLDYETVFGILGYLRREIEYTPWNSADRFISSLYTTFGPNNKDLNEFVHHLSEKFYDAFKVPADSIIPVEDVYERYSRELALKLACNSGNVQCLADTAMQDRMIAFEDRHVPKGLENVIYCSGFRATGNEDVWIEMWRKMQSTSDATFRSRAISALGCTGDKILLKDYLESTLGDGNSVSYTQAERRSIFSAALTSYSGLEVVIQFMKDFEVYIISRQGYTLETLLTTMARTVKSREQQITFNDYLLSLSHLDTEAFRRVLTVASESWTAQQETQNAAFLKTIQDLNEVFQETTTTAVPTTIPTTTASPTTTAPTTSVPTTSVPSTAAPTTPAPAGSTTDGATAVGIKLITIFACFFVAILLKN